ncbi:MAG: YrhB domain-containing protein [Acidobacteriaceae bacterium]|jgi:hypothetical protein
MDRITFETARTLADRFLRLQSGNSSELVIVDQSTRAEDFGWVFFYQSKSYVDTGDWHEMLVGNAPLIVDFGGQVHETGTGLPIEDYIEGFRAALKPAAG